MHEEKASGGVRAVEKGGTSRKRREAPATQTLAEISMDTVAVIATGIGEFDNVLGGAGPSV